jgi:transcriptional regulator with XRE-family HTH domain
MMIEQVEPNVGVRIRALRNAQGLSLQALAERCGLSANAISRIERGENSPTVSSLHRLATTLGVPITDLFEERREQAVVLVKRDQRRHSASNGVLLESLGTGLPNQQLEPFLMIVEPGAGNVDEPITHSGEEFVHCLEGEIEYRVGDEPYQLTAGDSLLFEATQSHSFYNAGKSPATLLMVFQVAEERHLTGWRHLA